MSDISGELIYFGVMFLAIGLAEFLGEVLHGSTPSKTTEADHTDE